MTGEITAPGTRSRLVRYVQTFSGHRYGSWVLAAIAFADSSFLPIPPDLLLVPMALLRPKQIWALCLICTLASSLGAVVGYVIGYELWNLVGARLVQLYGYGDGFTTYQYLIQKWGVWIIIAKGLTPIPFKIIAIAAGVAAMNPWAFLTSAAVGRALHFAIIAALIALWGDRVVSAITAVRFLQYLMACSTRSTILSYSIETTGKQPQ